MVIIEKLAYLLALMPLLADHLVTGRAPSSGRALLADVVIGALILAIVLLMRRMRRLADRVDGLRKTMNEAVIHDLKNPMTSIMGCLSCLVEDQLDAAQRKKLLQLALHGCKTQMTLLDTLVDTNRLEGGELPVRREALDTGRLFDECLDGVRGTAAYLGVKLEEDISREFPATVRADPALLPRVLLNLLHNALKYTPAGGTVSLRAYVEKGRPQLEVRDTGAGIAPEHIERLFGKYYRVEGSDQTGRRGSGLGLYFCRMVVEAHGGTIRVSSGVGRGTSIWFSLTAPEEAS